MMLRFQSISVEAARELRLKGTHISGRYTSWPERDGREFGSYAEEGYLMEGGEFILVTIER